MTASFSIFKDKTPMPKNEAAYGTPLVVGTAMCSAESNNAKLPGERKQPDLGVKNMDNVVRGHHV